MQNAYVRVQAMIGKKAQMRNEFINKLRLIADRATEALTLFEAPSFTDELVQAVEQAETPPEPPDQPNGSAPRPPQDGEDGHAAE